MSEPIIAYKGFDKDLKCQDMQYEIGKTYEINDKPRMCEHGYHYCNELRNVFSYKPSNCRICKVKVLGDVATLLTKSCTNKIEILEEIDVSKEDRIKYVYANEYGLSYDELKELLNKKFVLNDYLNDEDPDVRIAVAEQGFGLEKLVNDEDWHVREAVANKEYGLDKLINDEDWGVRRAVAEQGYGLDKLINDEDPDVRITAFNVLRQSPEKFAKIIDLIKEIY